MAPTWPSAERRSRSRRAWHRRSGRPDLLDQSGGGQRPRKVAGADLDGSDGADFNATGAGANASTTGPSLDPTANKIYWAGEDTNKLSFANLDRSGGVADLSTGSGTINEPMFTAILKAPSPAGDPVVSGGLTTGSTLSCSTGSWASDLLGAFLYRAPHSFAYQWTLDGTDISGATSSDITATDPGDYRCQVTASNAAGSAGPQTSGTHTVSTPPPRPPPPPPGTQAATGSAPARDRAGEEEVQEAEEARGRSEEEVQEEAAQVNRSTFLVQVHPEGISTLENLSTRERIPIPDLAAIGPQIERWLEDQREATSLQPAGSERAPRESAAE